MKRPFYLLYLLFLTPQLRAQTATGSWYGRADVDMAGIHNNYLTELVLKQKGTRVEGVFGYYFKDKYQSFFIHGDFDPKTHRVTILNIPLTYFNTNSTTNSVDCNTNFQGYLINSKLGSSLKGFFYRDEKYRYTCPDVRVTYLLDKEDQKHDSLDDLAKATARVWKPQADDYVVDVSSPRPTPATETPAAVIKRTDTLAMTSKDSTGLIAANNNPVQPTAAPARSNPVNPAVSTPTVVETSPKKTLPAPMENIPKKDTVVTAAANPVTSSPVTTNPAPADSKPVTTNPVSTAQVSPASPSSGGAAITPALPTSPVLVSRGEIITPAKPIVNPEALDTKKITESFTRRKAVLNRELEIESDSVRVSFYDNGEIDGDSISVFINSQPVLTHQELQAKALTIYIHLDSTKETNILSMFAENLGRIPPNTALMVVTDGKNRYEVFMSSSLTENATIQLKKKKKAAPNTGPGRRLSFEN